MKAQRSSLGVQALTFIALAVAALPAPADPPAGGVGKPVPEAAAAPGQPLKLPGLVIDIERRCVDVEAAICLDEGSLELIACTKGTKEHESIVTVEARPIHIHTALLLLGARNGNPAMRRALDAEATRWIDVPPKGDLIDVFLEFKDSGGKTVERPISDFIARADDPADAPADAPAEDKAEAAKAERFSNTFIFAGSHLGDHGDAPRVYLADQSGNVISMVSFGDELLCPPGFQSHENGALMWRVDSTHLPKLGTKVTLRLKVRKPPATTPTR